MKAGMQQCLYGVACLQMLSRDRLYVTRFHSTVPGIIRHDAHGRTRATLSQAITRADEDICSCSGSKLLQHLV